MTFVSITEECQIVLQLFPLHLLQLVNRSDFDGTVSQGDNSEALPRVFLEDVVVVSRN